MVCATVPRLHDGAVFISFLAVVTLVTTLTAQGATSLPGDSDSPHRCIHDIIRAKQLGEQSFSDALASGRFSAAAVLEVPRSSTPHASSSDGYAPIRIKVYTEDVYDPSKYCSNILQFRPDFYSGIRLCRGVDILTPAKQDLLVNTMIPAAIKMHSDRLSVRPLQHIDVQLPDDPVCGSFTIPDSVRTNGVDGYDYVLFVAAGPQEGNVVAWASPCGFSDGARPVAGVINVGPQYIDGTEQSIRTMAHEMLHALGFDMVTFLEQKMLRTVTGGLRGKPNSTLITSTQVLAKAKEHYGCSTIPGMEVDDTGGEGTAGSHWSVRNARDDMMCGYVGPMMRYSAITIAAMEDTGFYKGNYSMAEEMPWGNAAGCSFIQNKCVENGVSNFPTMFCGEGNTLSCTPDHLGIGRCNARTLSGVLPPYYQYFSNPRMGGDENAEYCPIVSQDQQGSCTGASGSSMINSVVGPSSRCLDRAPSSALMGAVCVDVQCDAATQTYSVKFDMGRFRIPCPEGRTVDAASSAPQLFTTGSLADCPPYLVMCPDTYNASQSPDPNTQRPNETERNDGAPRQLLLSSAAALATLVLLAMVMVL